MELNAIKTIYVVTKQPVSVRHIPELNGEWGLIRCYEVIRKTEKGYRLKVSYSSKGSMYLDEHYYFFETHVAALRFVAEAAMEVAATLEKMMALAVRLETDARYEIAKCKQGDATA